MATRATRYRSHSPTPSPTHTFEHSQPYHSPLTVGVMTLNSRAPSQEHLYNGRNDLTLPPFSKNLVVGTGAPNSSRNTSNHYNQPYPLSPPRDLRNYARNKRPMPIPENDNSRDMPYSFDDNYSEFAQTKPPSQPNDSDLPHSRTLPPLGSPQFNNGSRSLPPLNQSAYQPAYGSGLESHRSRQLSINSIISSPGINSPNSNYSAFGAPSHGNGTMKKRKKSFGAEGQGEIDNIDSDRDRDVIRPNGDSGGCGGGMNGSAGVHKPTSNVGLGLGLEDPDVRMAAEALGDLRADLNHSGIACRPNHLRLSTASSSSSSSSTNTGVNSPLSPLQPPVQYVRYQNLEDAPLLDLLQNNQNPVLRAATAAGRLSAAAYTTSKTLSPKFRYAAESVESVAKGRLGGAVGGLVSTVGKRSGLESLVRRSLANTAVTPPLDSNSRRDVENDNMRLPPINANGSTKKRKTSNGEDAEANGGVQSLNDIPAERKALQKQQQQDTQQQTWQTRLMLSTSGIGVMSEESLKSLKYCLDWLRWANNHLGKCIETLKTVLEEYERNRQSIEANGENPHAPRSSQQNRNVTSNEGCAVSVREDAEQERRKMLMGHMDYLKGEVMKTLKRVISVVDSYAGGALVGETRAMVKRQLLHLPKRLQVALVAHTPGAGGDTSASGTSTPTSSGLDPAAAAQRVIIVAKEGLDMMHNVSKLVEIALVGAEEWFEKLGRKREPEDNKTIDDGEDVKMVEAGQEPTVKGQITENGERGVDMKTDRDGDVKMES